MPWDDASDDYQRYLIDGKDFSPFCRARLFWLFPRPHWPAGTSVTPTTQPGTFRVSPDPSTWPRRTLEEVLQPGWWPLALHGRPDDGSFTFQCLTKWRKFDKPPSKPRGLDLPDAWALRERVHVPARCRP